MTADAQEVKAALIEIAEYDGWTWDRLEAAVRGAMSDIEDETEAAACGAYERADAMLMRRQEDAAEQARGHQHDT